MIFTVGNMWETKKKIPANNILFSRRWTRKITNRTQFAAKVTHVQDEFGIAKGSVDIPILYCMRRLSPHASYCRHPLKIPPQKKSKPGLCLLVESARALRPAEAPVILSSRGSNKILVGMILERMISSISSFE